MGGKADPDGVGRYQDADTENARAEERDRRAEARDPHGVPDGEVETNPGWASGDTAWRDTGRRGR